MTVRLNTKASVKSAAATGNTTTFQTGAETEGICNESRSPCRRELTRDRRQPSPTTRCRSRATGLASISQIGTQFLPLAFWYPMPNTPYTVRGADTAPFRLTVNSRTISSGVEKSGSPGSISFDQSIHGQPFFVQGDWDKLEGARRKRCGGAARKRRFR